MIAPPRKSRQTADDLVTGIIKTAIADPTESTRHEARKKLRALVEKYPDIVGHAVSSLYQAAEDAQESIRKGVQQTLCSLIETRPDIVDAALITHTAKIAVSDSNKGVRDAAQRTLETLTWAIPHWEWTLPYSE